MKEEHERMLDEKMVLERRMAEIQREVQTLNADKSNLQGELGRLKERLHEVENNLIEKAQQAANLQHEITVQTEKGKKMAALNDELRNLIS